MNPDNKYFIISYTDIIKSDSIRKYYNNDDELIFEIKFYSDCFLFVFYENEELARVVTLTKPAFLAFDNRSIPVNDYLNRFGYACIVN